MKLPPDGRELSSQPGVSVAFLRAAVRGCGSPAWAFDTSSTEATTTTWSITDLTGGLAAAAATTGACTTLTWALVGLHGDVERTTSPAATLTPDGAVNYTDEYGNPTASTTSTPRYGYLGAHQRAADPTSGLAYMGVRMYAPAMGRFLQVDPILGGNANPYDYPTDPITHIDVNGEWAISAWGVISLWNAYDNGQGFIKFGGTARCWDCTIFSWSVDIWVQQLWTASIGEAKGFGYAAFRSSVTLRAYGLATGHFAYRGGRYQLLIRVTAHENRWWGGWWHTFVLIGSGKFMPGGYRLWTT